MYIMDSNQYAIELVTYLLVLVVYFYELKVYMLLERNAFHSIEFLSQRTTEIIPKFLYNQKFYTILRNYTVKKYISFIFSLQI